MTRYQPALSSLTALILAVPVLAGATSFPELAACERKLALALGQEEPARCFYDLATGSGPSRIAAANRLQQLIEKHPESPWFPIYLGKVKQAGDLADLKKAESLYLLGARLAVEQGLAEAEFNARWGLCRILRNAGRFDEEEAEMERAAEAARASRLPVLRLRSEILQSLHWNAKGEFEQAYVALSGIRAQIEARNSYPLLRECLVPLSKAAQETGRFHDALHAYRQLAESAAVAGDLPWVAQARFGMASVRFYESAEVPSPAGRKEVLELARRALAAARASGRPSSETQALWMLGFLEGDGPARGHLERCFEVAATPGEKSSCRSALARLLASSDPRRAEASSREAIELAELSGNVQVLTAAWSNRMRVSWDLNSRERALRDAWAALDAIEALRNQQAGESGQPGLFSTWAEDYYWLSGQLHQIGQVERAFEIIERMRSRTLIDTLGLSRPGPHRQAGFASLEQVRGAVARDEALVSFQVAPWKDLAGDFGGGSWLLVSTRGATRVYRLPDRIWVRQAANTFTGMFTARNGSEAQTAAKLYEELLAPALAELPGEVRRLVIVPDDFLHRLPFAALATRYEVTLAPSATLWLHWREARPVPAVTRALVLADPVALANFGPLPSARTEGKAVRRHLGGGELLVGEEASEAYIKRNAAGPFGLFHFAAHAVTDEVNPDRSAIYLSPGNGKEDGVLHVREIVDLDLDGRIVVLSTCESASGEILRGEGVMGLARAFFQAGAHTVVASLWPLRDDDGAALFDRFYLHLSQGKSVAAALQAAQRDRMNDGAPAEAWAGVVVLGDGDRVPVPGGRRPEPVQWILGLIAALLLAYGARRALQRRTTIA
ncbi:MAG TPA: CHAT domain-containing protein [Thermoanaerobaculia bacterium]|jgi:CHAT domain-containing protein|nr:CHAT domain-containing protein [Thermoanaerobaculia bacterium]